jgi:hypothetical protein
MRTWSVYFNDDGMGFGKRLNFYKTTDLRGFKVLPYKWFLRLDGNLDKERHYSLVENIRSIYAPDRAELSDMLFVVIAESNKETAAQIDLGDGYVVSRDVCKNVGLVGYILGLSTANEVGAFGLWPYDFYKVSVKRPDIMIIAQLLIADKPQFWTRVRVAAKPGLIDKLRP